jgi:hypothetical protein
MSYQSKSSWWSMVAAFFQAGISQWTGAELDTAFENMKDSVAWEHQKYTMTSNTYDCANGNLQERTLTGNGTLAVTGAEAGKYYTLIKKGNFTLALPTSEFSSSGATVPSGTAVITFMYDGTDLYFNFAAYSAT